MRTSEQNRGLGTAAGVLLALAVLVAAAGWAIWNKQSAGGTATGEKAAIMRDFREVWTWSDASFRDGSASAAWSFRFDGRWTKNQAQWVAEELGIETVVAEDNHTYSGVSTSTGPIPRKTTLWYRIAATDEQRGETAGGLATDADGAEEADMVLLLEFGTGVELASIGNAVEELETKMKKEGLAYRSGFVGRGVRNDRADDAAGAIALRAEAARKESYDDGHTASITYYTSKLNSAVDSGGKRVNLQIAHSRSRDAKPELIVGVPLITGDYTAEN
ncbi:YwmB family TATA-box binding protein [Paenibacillus aurantiacus]|uniref:YwmB family TATA-box binding protein n=1 Tax=Paenibacillus aurantiacus TaxID=1936118 RepID=A0ABV5KI30_9BACL